MEKIVSARHTFTRSATIFRRQANGVPESGPAEYGITLAEDGRPDARHTFRSFGAAAACADMHMSGADPRSAWFAGADFDRLANGGN